MRVIDLGLMDYRRAWAEQERVHAEVVAGAEPAVLLVEHPPVITLGRRAELSASHLRVTAAELAEKNVDVVESDRGGDITFHGPGQLVAYPIIRLADHRLSIGGYVCALQKAAIATLGNSGIKAVNDPSAIGVWVNGRKICAVGVRIKKGTTLHGIALNVTTDLDYFNLIVPCGLDGRGVTSMEVELRKSNGAPISMRLVKNVLVEKLTLLLNQEDESSNEAEPATRSNG